ncbi:hypothetical protein E2C01_073927 [Portunus trituberculatus]|uniref:Uncharacterized protein n=1 Tax=Portunus trituberculatus TaxID=210409 RepID=A0A5B7I215_PORTR|nr:hypothetical protein [Portunus trituberculatus]
MPPRWGCWLLRTPPSSPAHGPLTASRPSRPRGWPVTAGGRGGGLRAGRAGQGAASGPAAATRPCPADPAPGDSHTPSSTV